MGNACECVCRQTNDDAVDSLLGGYEGEMTGQPRGPPPPYQPQAPVYTYPQMTQQQQVQLVQRLTLIQCLPAGQYEIKKEKGSEKKGDKRECPICMMEFVVGDPIRLLPCMHFYHIRCIDDWLMRSFTCPTCMQPVDLSLRSTVRFSQGLRRRRFRRASSSSSSSSSSSGHSSTEHLLLRQPSSEQLGSDVGSPRQPLSPPISPLPVYLRTPPSPPIIEIH